MSRTTTIDVDGRYFWTLDDVFAVWLEHMIEQFEAGAPDPWLLLHGLGTAARQRAVEAGDVPRDFTRTGEDVVTLPRVLEVADGFLGLLDGTFPADPRNGWWFLGTGQGRQVIERRS
ncbi:hypothetical protein [Lentzea albida]|uniref:Uncharacterized protein n=1 Tax=Lentzea albida TaxID=65499 RepID=A0A1H9GZI2_9PSEU|nr:hypothetical protein [Lentzea albida]SEQ55526.1 hypothetical protein SAMN04488000_103335 [Lentzea albida]